MCLYDGIREGSAPRESFLSAATPSLRRGGKKRLEVHRSPSELSPKSPQSSIKSTRRLWHPFSPPARPRSLKAISTRVGEATIEGVGKPCALLYV